MVDATETARALDDAGPMDPLLAVFRRRQLVAWTTLAVVAILIVPGAFRLAKGRRTFTSQVLLTISGKRSSSNLSGLAAQFGVSVPGSDPSQSPAFFVDLMKSRELLLRATTLRVKPVLAKDSITLLEHYGLPQGGAGLDRARRMLEEAVAVVGSQKSGIITLDVRDEDPAVATQLAGHLVSLVGDVNLMARRSQAAAERRFTEQRVKEADRLLRAAEDDERLFLVANRNCCASPDLQLQRDRLQRKVTMRQQVYTQLVQSLEMARLDEVRDTPLLTSLEGPSVPIRPDPTGLIKRALVGLLVGLGLGAFVAIGRESIGMWLSEDPVRGARFAAEARALRRDVLSPWRLFGRRRDLS